MLQWLRHKLASWLFPDLDARLRSIEGRVLTLEHTATATSHDIGDLAVDVNKLRNGLADAPPAQPKPEPRRFATWRATKAALERKSA